MIITRIAALFCVIVIVGIVFVMQETRYRKMMMQAAFFKASFQDCKIRQTP